MWLRDRACRLRFGTCFLPRTMRSTRWFVGLWRAYGNGACSSPVQRGPRAIVDQVLCGVLKSWHHQTHDQDYDQDGGQDRGSDVPGGEPHYRIVAATTVHGLVIAVGPQAAHDVRTVTERHLIPFITYTEGPVQGLDRITDAGLGEEPDERADSDPGTEPETAGEPPSTVLRRRRRRILPGLVAALVPAVRGPRLAPGKDHRD